MYIDQDHYNNLPLAIQEGALHLWATKLGEYPKGSQRCQLFQLNNFFVELYAPVRGQPGSVYTYSSTQMVEYVLRKYQLKRYTPLRLTREKLYYSEL